MPKLYVRRYPKPRPVKLEPQRCGCGCGRWVLPHITPRTFATGTCRNRACHQRRQAQPQD